MIFGKKGHLKIRPTFNKIILIPTSKVSSEFGKNGHSKHVRDLRKITPSTNSAHIASRHIKGHIGSHIDAYIPSQLKDQIRSHINPRIRSHVKSHIRFYIKAPIRSNIKNPRSKS